MANPQEKPRAETSRVAECTVTDCKYNEHEDCHAGEIRVQIGAQGAVCGTYEPEGGAARPRP